jgi:hypothetical protein
VRDFGARHPTCAEIGLIVEVAETSLARDRAKARIYAAAGVSIYLIFNLDDDSIEVYSQPDTAVPGFLQHATHRRGDEIRFTLSGAPLTLRVDDCLP